MFSAALREAAIMQSSVFVSAPFAKVCLSAHLRNVMTEPKGIVIKGVEMDARWIGFAGGRLLIPNVYQQVESMPEDPVGSVPLMADTGSSTAFVLLYLMPMEHAMPFGKPRAVIDGIHEALGDDQGLVEVTGGETPSGNPYLLSIVKTKTGRPGVQYGLTMDVGVGGASVHVQGVFDEKGVTGVRAAAVFATLRNKGEVGPEMQGWSSDPYDGSYKRGFLKNISEGEEFDEMFPEDPLSMARAFARCVTSGL